MGDTEIEIRIRRLDPSDDRSLFSSGDIDLDRFFQRFAGQNQFRHYIGTTYVADAGGRVAGFATVTVGELAGEKISHVAKKRLPAYPLPILRLARLAIDQRVQRQGVGKLLLKGVLMLALQLREQLGCVGVVVDAKPQAVAFYSRYGFELLEAVSGHLHDRPEPLPMLLPMQVIAKAIPSEDGSTTPR